MKERPPHSAPEEIIRSAPEKQPVKAAGKEFAGFNPLDIKAKDFFEFQEFSDREIELGMDKLFAEKNKKGEKEVFKGSVKSLERAWEATKRLSEETDREVQEQPLALRKIIERSGNWYKKRSFKEKVAVSAALVAAASASAAVGGAVGTAVITAAITGNLTQRMLGSFATFLTAEGALKKAAEKGGRERTKWEKRRHTFEAATLAILIGSGEAAVAAKNVSAAMGDVYHNWLGESESEAGVSHIAEAATVPLEYVKKGIIKTGGSVEKALINQLKSNLIGYDGNPADQTAINKWAGEEAHRLAIKGGYFDPKTGIGIHVGTKGIGNVAYVLEVDEATGEPQITEYVKDPSSGEFRAAEAHGLIASEGAEKFTGETSAYEYKHTPETVDKKSALEALEGKKTDYDLPSFAEVSGEAGQDKFYELAKQHYPDTLLNYTPENLQKLEMLDHLEKGEVTLDNLPTDLRAAAEGEGIKNIADIYGGENISRWFWSVKNHYLDAWEHVRHKAATEILTASGPDDPVFGVPVSGLDVTELENRGELLQYLKNLSHDAPVFEHEELQDYIKRAEAVKMLRGAIRGGGVDRVPLPKNWE